MSEPAPIDHKDRQIRRDKRGQISSDCVPILERLPCSAETWLDYVTNFHQRFRHAAGLAPSQQSFRLKLRSSSSLAS
jgi:hypothetical protein